MQIEGPRPSTSPAAAALARHGYVEEELVVSGTADLYRYDKHGNTVRSESGIPFTTRVLVRRPADPAVASDTLVIEPLHPSGDMPSAWPRTGRMITRSNWSWVGVTQDLAGLAATKSFDPDRYAELDIPHVGLGYDIVSQVATWLRGPTAPIAVDHLFMTGASHTGSFQRVLLGDGFHDRTRLDDDSPAIEGYLIQISSGGFMLGGYNPIAPDVERPPAGDRRRIIGAHDVPVIELLSEGEAETNRDSRRLDSDEPHDRYRLYEVPGACHMSSGERGHGPLAPTDEEPSDFPMWAIAGATLSNCTGGWSTESLPREPTAWCTWQARTTAPVAPPPKRCPSRATSTATRSAACEHPGSMYRSPRTTRTAP
jgi:hypothetical protein